MAELKKINVNGTVYDIGGKGVDVSGNALVSTNDPQTGNSYVLKAEVADTNTIIGTGDLSGKVASAKAVRDVRPTLTTYADVNVSGTSGTARTFSLDSGTYLIMSHQIGYVNSVLTLGLYNGSEELCVAQTISNNYDNSAQALLVWCVEVSASTTFTIKYSSTASLSSRKNKLRILKLR